MTAQEHYIRDMEHRGHRWRLSPLHICPDCNAALEILCTSVQGIPRAMRCTGCSWSMAPDYNSLPAHIKRDHPQEGTAPECSSSPTPQTSI